MKELTGLSLCGALMLAGCKPEVLARVEPPEQPQCFEVISPGDQRPYNLVKIDKCTGQSWLLVETNLQDADPSQDKKELHAWRWSPLTTNYRRSSALHRLKRESRYAARVPPAKPLFYS